MTLDWNPGAGVEVGLEDGYKLWSQVYDSDYNPLIAVEKREVERLLDTLAFSDVLDAGAGTGRWSLSLAARGARVTGIDGSHEMLAMAQSKATSVGLDVRFDHGRIDALPYADGSFDLVICALVLSHLEDFGPIMSEFARVLRPGGSVIVTDFHPDIVSAGGRAEFVIDGTHYLLPNPSHVREDYIDTAEAAGLRVAECTDIPVADLKFEEVKKIFLKLFGDRQLCLVLLAQKPTLVA